MSSLTTCDPSDIHLTIDSLAKNAVKCSVIGLAAEVRICKELCNKTSGWSASVSRYINVSAGVCRCLYMSAGVVMCLQLSLCTTRVAFLRQCN